MKLSLKKTLAKILSTPLVVDYGTSGMWTYRKWSNGIAECWGVSTATNKMGSQSNFGSTQAYYSDNAVNFPFTFYSTPTVVIGPIDNAGGLVAGEIDGLTTTYVGLRVIGAKNDTSIIHVYVIGLWKPLSN